MLNIFHTYSNKINDIRKYFGIMLLIFLLVICISCYMSFAYYSNDSYFSDSDFIFKKKDTLLLTNFIYHDTALSKHAARSLENQLKKIVSFTVINADYVDSLLTSNKIYSLPYNIPENLLSELYKVFKIRLFLTGYFTELEDADIGKDAVVGIHINIYDLMNAKLIWSCSSKLHITSPNIPQGSTYIASIHSKIGSIEELIEDIVNKEFMKVLISKNKN